MASWRFLASRAFRAFSRETAVECEAAASILTATRMTESTTKAIIVPRRTGRSRVCSEQKLERNLPNSSRARRIDDAKHGRSSRNPAAWIIELRVIADIEKFETEFELRLLREFHVLQ